MRNKSTLVSIAVLGLLVAVTGVAAATEHEDTAFNYGYDEANRLLLLNTTPFDHEDPEAACQLDENLEDDEGTEHEVTYSSLDPIDVDDLEDADGTTCELEAAEVSGPNGQVNHGMFMKAFNSWYDGNRRGCVNRFLAQSDLGKGTQQIQANPDAEEFVPESDSSTADFFTALADCEKNNGDEASVLSNGNGKGKGKGRPDSPGKSASAPGHDR